MNNLATSQTWKAIAGGFAAAAIAAISLVRGLLLLPTGRPKTLLRILCIVAFDTLHMLRQGKWLPMRTLKLLAALLDFGAWANAALDHKDCCRQEGRRTLGLLKAAGIRSSVVLYLQRLRAIELQRPLPGGDHWQFRQVELYRETVVRLSLGVVATIADCAGCLDEGVAATDSDADLNLLFRLVMQCQIIDDVVDYAHDLSAGLPSFLTASDSLAHAFEWTRLAILGYADGRDRSRLDGVWLLRLALWLVSSCTRLVIVLGRWRQGAKELARQRMGAIPR